MNVGNLNGIAEYGKVERISTEGGKVSFYVKTWRPTKQLIKPVKYGISTYIMTTLTQLNEAKELPELFMKNKQETTLWKMLRRVSDRVTIQLNKPILDEASAVETFMFHNMELSLNRVEQTLSLKKGEEERTISSKLLIQHPTLIFKEVLSLIEK